MSNLGVGMIIIWCVTIIGVKKRHFDLMSGASPSGKGMLAVLHLKACQHSIPSGKLAA
jgi:hypothetical protein